MTREDIPFTALKKGRLLRLPFPSKAFGDEAGENCSRIN